MTEEELAKDLGLVSAMTIGIGTMIGTEIFVLPVAPRAAVRRALRAVDAPRFAVER